MQFSRKYVFAAVFAISTALNVPSPVLAAESQTGSISVSGTGSVSVAPDMAVVSVGVVREAETAREALDQNNAAVASILDTMQTNGIAEKDLQTSGFSIRPLYFYPKRTADGEQPAPEITGYSVSNNLNIRIREFNKTGEILDLVVSMGVNSGGNIRFTNQDTAAILKEARGKAVKDALEKAQTLADAAEVDLGEILNISENAIRPVPLAINQARAITVQEDASAVPVAGGENTYQVTVQISWEIEQ